MADYDAWKAKQQQDSVGKANIVMGAVDASPDEVARDLTIASDFARSTGNPAPPAPLVREYRNEFQRRIDEAKNSTILSKSPRLTEWLRNPENSAVARDDLQGLSWWETTLGAGSNAISRGISRVPQAYNQWRAQGAAQRLADQSKGFGDILSDETAIRDSSGKTIGSAPVGPGDLFWTGSRYFGSRIASLLGNDQADIATFYQQQAGEIAKRVEAIPMSPAGERFKGEIAKLKGVESTADKAAGFFAAAGANFPDFLAFLVETGAESIPMMGAAVGVGVVAGPTAGAMTMGGLSAAQEYGSSPTEYFKEKGIDVSTPEGARKAISNPDLMRDAISRGQIRGLIVGAMDGLSGGVAGKQLAANPIANMALQSIVQAAFGAGGEAGAQLASGQQFDIVDVIVEGLAEFATAPVEVAGMGFTKAREAAAKAKDAEARVALFEELSGQAQASALRNRLPDRFRQFVAEATKDGPVENVYVPADQFMAYFQSHGIDPFTLVEEELDGVTRDDLDAALAGGGDLQIPTSTYAAKIAGTPHDAFLMENMRFDPDQMTAKEAAEFNAKAQDALQEAWEVAEQTRQEAEASRSFEQEIYDTMVSRLRVAGRSTDVATTEATLWPAFYRVMAERANMAIDEFMARYPLPQVEGAIPQGLQLRDVDALNRTLAEARARKAVKDKRTSLLEFISEYGGINDVGGELKARDAEIIKPGKGKKNLRLARKGLAAGVADMFGGSNGRRHGVDDVAAAAISAGYLADNPIANQYRAAMEAGTEVPDITLALWDAIDAELRGERQFSAQDDVDPTVRANEELDAIEAYLISIGASLDDDDASIKAALTAAEAEAGKAYGQAPFLFQNMAGGPRGLIQFSAGGIGKGDTIIRLFETADLSTFVHESGHYFLTVMQDMAARGEVTAAEDFGAVKEWWRSNAADVAKDGTRAMPDAAITEADVIAAIENGTTGDVIKDAAVDVGMQEQWARAFEGYLMEGKAPSAGLRGAFEKFRSWLLSVYRRMAGLNVKPSDELRAVFDRMLATDEEIAKAQDEAGGNAPVFATAEQMGLSEDEFARFMKLRSQAEDDAKARLLKETMAPIRRERQKWFREEKAKVREEVEREVNAYPMFRAVEWMGNRRWLGEGQPEAMPDIRLSKDILVERYGEGVLKTLPRGKQTVYTVEGGLDPDEAAGWFGFDSGDQMIKAMEQAPRRSDAISAETDRVMNERHGDVLNDGAIEAEALDAVHGDKRGQWIAAELKAISEVADAGVVMTAKEARASARHTIARLKVRDATNANRFLAAERKAAEEASRLGAMLARDGVWLQAATRRLQSKARAAAKGGATVDQVNAAIERRNAILDSSDVTFDVKERQTKAGKTLPARQQTSHLAGFNENAAKLVDAKRRQLLNHALYMEARIVTDEVEKAERFVRKLGKASTRERIAGAGRRENAQVDYLAAIDEILSRYDFTRMSSADEQRRGSLNAFVEAMKLAGRENELAIPDDVLMKAARAPYKTIPVEEFRGVIDALKNLEHVAGRWDDLIDAKNKRLLSETTEAIGSNIDKNLPKRPPGPVATKKERALNAVRAYMNVGLNVTTLLREIDGLQDRGAAYMAIKAPIDEAQNRLITRKQTAAEAVEKLFSVYSKDERRRMSVRMHDPALGFALSKWETIALALNTGNAGNLERLMSPQARRSFTEGQIEHVKAKLDARDADFVQSVWDYIGSFRDDIAARERRVSGTEPAWVEAAPVNIGGKELRGGYYPIKYDPRLSAAAADRETADIAQALTAGRFGKAQTKNGHLKERAAGGDGSIDLDIGVFHKHVNQVMYDLEMSEPVSNGWRIIQSEDVRGALTDAGRVADFDTLQAYLKDAAEGELGATSTIGNIARQAKSNFTMAKLAFNISNALLQGTGLTQAAVVVGKRDIMIGVMKTLANPARIAREVAEASPFMSTRQKTFNKDIMDFLEDSKTGMAETRFNEYRQTFGKAGFFLAQKVQWYFADVPTWIAGYEQGLRKFGGDEATARAHADDLVKRSHGSGLFTDRTAIERGTLSSRNRQSEFIKLFSTLGSYMFTKMNAAYETSLKHGRAIREDGFSVSSIGHAASLAVDLGLLFVVEAMATAVLKGQLPGQGDDQDESWLKWLAKNTALSVLGTMPFVRDAGAVFQGHSGGGAYGSMIEDSAKGVMSLGKAVGSAFSDDVELKKTDLVNVLNMTGTATGMPTVFIQRVVNAESRRLDGENVSPVEYVFGKWGKSKN